MHEREIELKEIIILLKRHLYLFSSVIIVVMTLTVAHIYRSIKIYSSTASIEIEPKAANVLGDRMEIVSTGSQGYYWSNKEYYATQYEIIQSRSVAEKVLELIPGENILEYLGLDISKIEEEKLKDIDPVNIILGKLTVSPQKNSNIVKISVEDKDPEKAAFLANAFANAYIDFNLEKKYFATKDAARWLSDQSINLKKSLEDSEKMLFDFKQNNNVLATTFEAKQAMLATRIEKFTNTLTDQEIRRNAVAAKIEEYSKTDLNDPNESFLKEASKDNQLINNLKMKYIEVVSKLDESEKFYGEKYPKVLSLSTERDTIHDSLKKEISGVIKSYDLELKTLESEMAKNRKMLSDSQTEAIMLNKLDIDYSKLLREVETNKKLYDIVLERTKQADLSALLKNNNVRIIDNALSSKIPVKPRKNLILLIGLILSMILGSLAIFVVEFFDTRFRTFKEFETITKKPLLGIIPKFEFIETSKFKEIAFEEKKQSFAVESFRSLRTNIKLSNPDHKIAKLLVTSSITQEGKTTVSANIGVGYSVAGKSVLIVDADMRKPRVHKLFGLKNEKGLSTLIVGEHTLTQVTNKDVYSGLDVITCGPIPPNPAELLESARFSDVLAEMSAKYDLVIFDSPPLSPVSDAATIAPMTDGVIVVVNVNKTPRDIFKMSVSKIMKPGIHFLGTVINNFDLKHEKKFKSYYNYSYYHSPYKTEKDEEVSI
ncbi:MAG TPA: polysaccharide biosynthesis tyrosine autokinase [bacterium]|nr:polysaccharide biosynthesis tyrosine autokinase [bacterium]